MGWIQRLNAGEIRRGLRNGDFREGAEIRAARRRLALLTSGGSDRPRGVIVLRDNRPRRMIRLDGGK